MRTANIVTATMENAGRKRRINIIVMEIVREDVVETLRDIVRNIIIVLTHWSDALEITVGGDKACQQCPPGKFQTVTGRPYAPAATPGSSRHLLESTRRATTASQGSTSRLQGRQSAPAVMPASTRRQQVQLRVSTAQQGRTSSVSAYTGVVTAEGLPFAIDAVGTRRRARHDCRCTPRRRVGLAPPLFWLCLKKEKKKISNRMKKSLMSLVVIFSTSIH